MAQPSYSDYVFGNSNNAAAGGSSWGMSSALFGVPTVSGVDINGVFYRYTAVKNQADPYTVSIQNEAADGNGYIFRETDDWSGKSGATIQRFVPLQYSPLGNWGEGSIAEVGIGSVEEPVVLYSYRQDLDAIQPELPTLPEIPTYDALADGYVNAALQPTDRTLYEDDEFNKSDSEEEDDGRLEKALAAQENALTLAGGVTQVALLQAMNSATDLNNYYAQQIAGGRYPEPVVLIGKNIPDNRRALRSLGQQKLHTQLVDLQYKR